MLKSYLLIAAACLALTDSRFHKSLSFMKTETNFLLHNAIRKTELRFFFNQSDLS